MLVHIWSVQATVLILLCFRPICVLSRQTGLESRDRAIDAAPQKESALPRLHHKRGPDNSQQVPKLTIPEAGNSNDIERATSLGVKLRPRQGRPIKVQAVAGTIIQALYEAYNDFGLFPNERKDQYQHAEASAGGPTTPTFAAVVTMQAVPNATSEYAMTNSRVVGVLSLLGFDLSEREHLSQMVEYDFDVVIDQWQRPEIRIATGAVENSNRTILGSPVTES